MIEAACSALVALGICFRRTCRGSGSGRGVGRFCGIFSRLSLRLVFREFRLGFVFFLSRFFRSRFDEFPALGLFTDGERVLTAFGPACTEDAEPAQAEQGDERETEEEAGFNQQTIDERE